MIWQCGILGEDVLNVVMDVCIAIFIKATQKEMLILVYLCFSTDFLIEEADGWRNDCWKMIKTQQDCTFLFLTKRIDRFMKCIPDDWEDGYDNVVVCCTIENQKNADWKLSIFKDLPIKHKCITAQPLLESIDIEIKS